MLIEIGTVTLAGVVRSLAGWLENSLEDGKIDAVEWKLLGATVVRVAIIAGGVMGAMGLTTEQVDAVSSGAVALVIDMVLQKMKK